MFKLYLICLSICILKLSEAGITFKDCGSKNGVVQSLEVEGCTEAPCTLYKGKSATMKVQLKTNIATSTLATKCSGVLFGIPIPFPLPEPNACNLGANCPVAKDDLNQITLSLPILNEYPSLGVDVRLQFLTDSNQNVVCFQFPVKISS